MINKVFDTGSDLLVLALVLFEHNSSRRLWAKMTTALRVITVATSIASALSLMSAGVVGQG
ncbi:hypothetical protein [Micromonospora sp. NPDC049374]|uniref:hypothetical protein n=1 Tax=Micromonospora sp. NPDC049374 TaxID=3154352 RepID=UPI0034487846